METAEIRNNIVKNRAREGLYKFSMPGVTLMLIVLALALFAYTIASASAYMHEDCIEGLNKSTDSAASSANRLFEQNEQLLEILAGILAEEDTVDIKTSRVILTEFGKHAGANRFRILLPDNTIVTQDGPLETKALRFANVAPYGIHFSPLTNSLQYRDQIIRQYYPVVKNGETVAVAYAVYPTVNVAAQIAREDYNGELYLMVIDRRTGEVTIDTHQEKNYTNIAQFHSFVTDTDTDFDSAVAAILRGEEGFVRFRETGEGEVLYMTYLPSEYDEFEIVTIISEETAMAGAFMFRRIAMLLAVLEIVLLGVYGAWVMHRNRKDIAAAVAEEKVRVALQMALERQQALEAVDKLAEDFEYVGYLNRTTGQVTRYGASGDFLEMVKRFESEDATDEKLAKFLLDFILPLEYHGLGEHDASYELEAELQAGGHLSADFVLPLRGRIRNYRIKLVLDSETQDGLFIGIYNIDREKQLAVIAQEHELALKENQNIIGILADDFDAVFYLDLQTERYKTFSMSKEVDAYYGKLFRGGTLLYTPTLRLFAEKFVDEHDRESLLRIGSVENIQRELANKTSFKTVFLSAQGRYFEVKIVKAETDDSGAPVAVAVGFADRDGEIRSEQEYQRELEYARDRANAANAAKSAFLFNMSHDIRTPMNAIKGFSERAEKHIDNREIVLDSILKVEQASDHLLKLINDILDMARIESGKVVIEEEPTDIRSYSGVVCSMLESLAEERGVALIEDAPEVRDPYIYVDQDRMNQVLINLISNSIKYTRPGGQVRFSIRQTESVRPDEAAYDFVVQDNGIGMTKEFMEHMFEQFSRERNSTTSGIQGTGLGLAITNNLVRMMGGTIEIDSEVNHGTTAIVHMSFRLCGEETAGAKTETEVDTAKLRGKRILLVEDNELNREIARDILEEHGMLVEEAEDGGVAVKMVAEVGPYYYDIVLMDVQMPYMDGYTATAVIRELSDGDYSELPIIAMTANAFEEDKRKALEAGMNAHLSKPIVIQTFLETLARFSE
ncbi:MAG: response regulator [Ruminococcaceae bacterium]|nr:response regulator [Oscillospiraceae bacterium]